jgi:hypothetical protein
MWSEVVNLWPAWLAITLAGLVTVNQLISESSKFANVLGSIGRKLHERARERRRMDTIEFSTAVREAVATERKGWEEDEERALKIMEGRLEYVTQITEAQQQQLKDLNFDIRCLTAYSHYETAWHNKLRMLAARADLNGGSIPIEHLPHHMEYSEFEERCKSEGHTRWREWQIV